ncbi:hypothetical protein GCM10011575_39900 [Microlunatus endophyticus]|uniref:DUF1707 domain-containing protein n=1 Tax=Microlunatus endophyticus TaxID=1716077 RepID=A0A917W882_9ACTN|nr:DUF1707 domain-containing protein [Microlunatus endophyticus]GGL77689.1 hypothetical protein GCM10011575_39900 [Microlunatus endophyticus]
MSELPISSKYRSTPDAPVSDGEREELTRRLNDAFAAGRLDQETYSAHLDQLYAAQRLGDLVPVVQNLPALQTYSDPAMVQQASGGRPGEVSAARPANRAALYVVGVVVIIAILLIILLAVLF